MEVCGQLHGVATLSSVKEPWYLSPRTYWLGGWVGHKAGLDAAETKRISFLLRRNELRSPGRPARGVVTILSELFWLQYCDWSTTLRDVASHPGRATSGEKCRHPFHRRLGGPAELIWALWRTEESLVPAGDQTPTPPLFSPSLY
jgi:hypothetical protein